MITNFPAVAKYVKSLKPPKKIFSGTLYKHPYKGQLALDIIMLCMIDCFTLDLAVCTVVFVT